MDTRYLSVYVGYPHLPLLVEPPVEGHGVLRQLSVASHRSTIQIYEFHILNLLLMRGEGGNSIHIFKELFSQPKLDIIRGVYGKVYGYDLGDTKSVDTPVS